MPGEESQKWKAEVLLAGWLGWLLSCFLPGTAEAGEGRDAVRVCLLYKRLHQGLTPVYRFPPLSASGVSAFAVTPAAPPGSGQCLAGP